MKWKRERGCFHTRALHADRLVHLNVPLVVLLEAREPLIEVKALALGDILEHGRDARHHP